MFSPQKLKVGTSKMSVRGDPTGVVDPELKVHNMQRLRIVDTSIIPEAPTAHTNSLSVLIGECNQFTIICIAFHDFIAKSILHFNIQLNIF